MTKVFRSATLTKHQFSFQEKNQSELQQFFKKNNYIYIENFFSEELLSETLSSLNSAPFYKRDQGSIGTELCLAPGDLITLLNFLVNRPQVFNWVQKITSSPTLKRFDGRVYKYLPGEKCDSWHDDMQFNRHIGMSVNLSSEQYFGGTLQLRAKSNKNQITEVKSLKAGDAILFKIDKELEHQNTQIEHVNPKLALAGWFQSSPDFWSTLIAPH